MILSIFTKDDLSWIVPSTVALIAALITIITYKLNIIRKNKNDLITKFNEMYNKTFKLRMDITNKFNLQLNREEFFYELDTLLGNSEIREEVLDYMTYMEDLFFYILTPTQNKTLEKLMSYAFYTRLTALYGFLLKLRQINNNPKMFINYEKVLHKLETIKKIKINLNTKNKKYYIGIRESDIQASNKYFEDSVAMFSNSTKKSFTIRPNQNRPNKYFFPYLERQINQIISKDNSSQFIFYNNYISYNIAPKFQSHFLCVNKQACINQFSDKLTCKNILITNNIPIIAFKTMSGKDIQKQSNSDLFVDCDALVIQDFHGGGGIGTFLLNKDSCEIVKNSLLPLRNYLVSNYIKNSISVNTHVFISEKQTVLSPASIQIIQIFDNQICYRGADFIAFKELPQKCRNTVKELSLKIANIMRKTGYYGVAGLDFIVDADNKVYCAEINTRFQASSILLDMYLSSCNKSNFLAAHSIYELNEQAFAGNMKTDLSFDDEIPYSCYYYYKGETEIKHLKAKHDLLARKAYKVDDDGLSFDESGFDNDSYLFRAIFNHAICTISPDHELWINDNIRIEDSTNSLLELKIALLNQGIRLKFADSNVKVGVYESVDIRLIEYKHQACDININCAYNINLAQYSPYELDCKNNKLLYYGDELGAFEIERNLLKKLNETSQKILYIATDRLRVKLISGCEMKNYGLGCAFCNVPISQQHFNVTEIDAALKELKIHNIQFRHILIGGGTNRDKDSWDKITDLAHCLKNYFADKPICLMSVLPPINRLQELKDAGISEVAFNLEVVDRNLCAKLMPGKNYDTKIFYQTMQQAVKIFGVGNVRSALLVGLDKESNLINGIKRLAKSNILPCLSALRCLPHSKFDGKIQPTNEYLLNIYNKCDNVVKHSKSKITYLGPLCKHCQNNMLIL